MCTVLSEVSCISDSDVTQFLDLGLLNIEVAHITALLI